MPAQSFSGFGELRVRRTLEFSDSQLFELPSWETNEVCSSHEEVRCPEYM
jgi:hypothetical protein